LIYQQLEVMLSNDMLSQPRIQMLKDYIFTSLDWSR